MKNPSFVFFGTPHIAVTVLEEMKTFGIMPSLVVCNPNAPTGRKQIITPPPVKVWAEENSIPVFQPASLKDRAQLKELTETSWDFFVVMAYGKILPEWLLEIPKYKTINAHPSLLPKMRGASPVRSALLTDMDAIGVTIMRVDKELDHGPILLQQAVSLNGTPIPGNELDETLGRISGCLLVEAMQKLPTGEIAEKEQDHEQATFCTKITKEMGEIKIDPHNLPHGSEALSLYAKICAFDGWPGTFFFYNNKRIKIVTAEIRNDTLTIQRVIPEGKKEIDFDTFLKQ